MKAAVRDGTLGLDATLVVIVALAAVLGATASVSAQGGPIKIGFINPDGGPMAQLGLDLRDGFQLYWSEVGGKAGGRPVEVLVESDGVLQNIPVASFPNIHQFWKWTPEQLMAMPAYLDMKNKWAK